jgi:Glutaredoxin-like domain (DUF836)
MIPRTMIPKVVLYSGASCHLCDDVHEVLDEVRRDLAFELEVRDIASDPTWFAAYRYDIPVVTIDGVEAFRHRLTAAELRAALLRTPPAA